MSLAVRTSILDGGKPKYNPSDYSPFDKQADYVFNQGWHPVLTGNDAIVYQNKYSPAFSNIVLNNGKPEGTVQVVGNRNGLFDVQIVDKDGKPEKLIMKSQPFAQVDNYFRNSQSVIQQRMNRVQGDPNIQKQAVAAQFLQNNSILK